MFGALISLMLGCASGPTERIAVRWSRAGEVFPQPPAPPPPPPGTKRIHIGCRTSGPPAEQFYEPVVEFARANLLKQLDGDAHPRDAHAYRVLPGMPPRRPGQGIEIVVDPRTVTGALQTSIKIGSWDAGHHYCLHVVRRGTRTTIVVEQAGGWIL